MLVYFYHAVVLMMVGAVLITISSEWMLHSLDTQNSRLEEYELENRRLELQFAQPQKLESLGVLAGGIAHDFNTDQPDKESGLVVCPISSLAWL